MISRLLLIGAYLVMALLGVLSVIAPPPTYEQNSSQWGTYAWSAFLVVGGLLCAAEVIYHHWAIKAAGLTLLITSVLSYSLVLLLREDNPTIPYGGWLLLAFSLFLAWRLSEIIRLWKQRGDGA